MTENKKSAVEILLVEDNRADIRLAQEVLGLWTVPHNMNVVQTGEEALSFLHRQGENSGKHGVSLVLLDLNLPGISGIEVLQEIKKDPGLKHIPVIILTTSFMEADVVKAYDSHANCYIVKPIDLNEFDRVARSIENFWLTVARLPEAG